MKCVHLDFHTSPDIEGIGESFNKDGIYSELYNDWINSWEEKLHARMM